MINDYTKQALVWDWDGYDNTPEYQYWCKYAAKFGRNVLIPMCALGQTGAYMSQNGFSVTAFDITYEMILEGKKRFDSLDGLSLKVADICEFDFDDKDFDFSFIAGNGDLHLLSTINEVQKGFMRISNHLRAGGCLALELTLPFDVSRSYRKKVFHPRVPGYTDKKVWKENEGKYSAEEKRHYINQTVYIQEASGIESFTQSVCLQYYERNEILYALQNSGFSVKAEYRNRNNESWEPSYKDWMIEAVKRK